MATAIATITIDNYPAGINNLQRTQHVRGTVAIQASPATYATGGLALNFLGAKDSANNFIEFLSGQSPTEVTFYDDSATPTGYVFKWNKAANAIQILAASAGAAGSAPLVELANALAIPASISGGTIRFKAVFSRNVA